MASIPCRRILTWLPALIGAPFLDLNGVIGRRAFLWLWGALGATYLSLQLNAWLAVQVGDLHVASARSAVFIAPWVEEPAKAAVIFAIVLWRRHDFNAVVAGVVYGGLVGIGFAFTENIVYYGQLFQQVYDGANKDAALDAASVLEGHNLCGAPARP